MQSTVISQASGPSYSNGPSSSSSQPASSSRSSFPHQIAPPNGAPSPSPQMNASAPPTASSSNGPSFPPQNPQYGYGQQPPYYPQQPNGVPPWFPPNYYQQQQPFQPRHFPSSNASGPANYRPMYGGDGYPGASQYYGQYPQMGGPGPGTMQNGYGGYNDFQNYAPRPNVFPPSQQSGHSLQHPQTPQHSQSQSQQLPYPTPPPENHRSSQAAFGSLEPGETPSSSASEAPPYQQQPPPPSIPPPPPDVYNHQNYPHPPSQGPPYPQMYPPNHPYAHGGGFGSPYYPVAQAYGHQAYPDYPSYHPSQPSSLHQMPPDRPPPNPRENSSGSGAGSSGRALNPAAKGFAFTPSSQKAKDDRPNGIAKATVGAGTAAAKTNDPVFASLELPKPAETSENPRGTHVDNGNVEVPVFAPIIVNGEKLKVFDDLPPSIDEVTTSSLGLSTTTTEVSPVATIDQATSTKTAATSVGASVEQEAAAKTPMAQPTELDRSPTPTSGLSTQPLAPATAAPKGIEPVPYTFVGPTVSGYQSPPPTATAQFSPSQPGPLSISQTLQNATGKAEIDSGITGPLRLRPSRPEAGATGNTYFSSLHTVMPKSVEIHLEVTSESASLGSSRGRRDHRRKAIFSAGVPGRAAPRTSTRDLTFGDIGPSSTGPDIDATPSDPIPDVAATPPTPAVPADVPKVKPSSWAALLKPAGASTSTSAAATKASSPAFTPSATLSPSSEAGPSRLPFTPSEPVTPKSSTSALPPPSTGASTTAGPRPVFNYAAAAAAGAALSPQEELLQLLSNGIKGKFRDVRMSVPRGLINTGNMCFANTILQVLVYCSPFAELFEELAKRLKADLARRTPLLEAMIVFLREFIPTNTSTGVSNLERNGKQKERDLRNEAFIPENVYDAMKENKRFDSMRRGFQEDAEEYLGFFLDTLHEELLYLISRTQPSRVTNGKPSVLVNGDASHEERSIQRPVSPGADNDGDGWLEVGKKQKTNVVRNTETRESAISRLFGGTLRSVLHTPGSKDSVTLEPYQPLQLDIQSPEVLSITDALRHLTTPETVPGVWSTSRNANVDATKQVFVEAFPNVLILHLKRFVYDGAAFAVVKRGKPVAYGTELVVPPDVMSPGRRGGGSIKYKLFGVVYHHGTSAGGGHYTVAVARQDVKVDQWIHFDDETVSNIPTEQVVVSQQEAQDALEKKDVRGSLLVGGRERCAYLLFYQRVR